MFRLEGPPGVQVPSEVVAFMENATGAPVVETGKNNLSPTKKEKHRGPRCIVGKIVRIIRKK